jgi:hypothetical protein
MNIAIGNTDMAGCRLFESGFVTGLDVNGFLPWTLDNWESSPIAPRTLLSQLLCNPNNI